MNASPLHALRPRFGGRHLLLALLIALPLYLMGTFGHDLWRPAEAREAGIAREMIENGNWVATHLNGCLFLEKPPLYTWCLAWPMQLWGYQDWVVRIPVFLFTLGTLLLTYNLARRQLGIPGAQGALISLASMWLFLEVNHGAMIDNGLVFFITLAMLAGYRLAAHDRPLVLWNALFYLGLALAFLCKGAVGVLLIALANLGFVLAYRQWKPFFSWRLMLGGLAIWLVLVGGWLGALWAKGGQAYFRVFFIDNHLYRFQGQAGPVAGCFYYLPYLLMVALPWACIIPAGLWVVRKQWMTGNTATRRFWHYIFWWLGAMLFLLSVAGSKDNQYLLPLLPALAMFSGAWVEWTLVGKPYPRWCLGLTWLFSVLVVLGVVAMPLLPVLLNKQVYVGSLAWSLGLALVGWGVWRALWRQHWRAVWGWLALLVLGAGLTLGLFVEKALNQIKSTKPLCELIRTTLPVKASFWGYDLGENTEGLLIFYGLPPQRLTTLGDALILAQSQQPALVLLMSRRPQHIFKDQLLAMGGWQILRQELIGGRHYWLMGNAAAALEKHAAQ